MDAVRVDVTDAVLTVELVDGRSVSVPLVWYPRLAHGTPDARRKWRLIGRGEGISMANLLSGKPSGESRRSFKRWLELRGNST